MSRRLNLREKMEQINQKFTTKSKNNIANQVLQTKVSNIKKKMEIFATRNQQEISNLRQEATELLETLQNNNAAYERETQMQLKELEALSQMLNGKVETEIVHRKEKEMLLVETMEKKLKMLRAEIEREKAERIEVIEQIAATLRSDVPALMAEVEASAQSGRQEEQKLEEIVAGEMGECEAMAAEYRQQQQTANNKIYGLIRELTLKAKKQVQQQKQVREQTHEEILSYVQETCSRLAQ